MSRGAPKKGSKLEGPFPYTPEPGAPAPRPACRPPTRGPPTGTTTSRDRRGNVLATDPSRARDAPPHSPPPLPPSPVCLFSARQKEYMCDLFGPLSLVQFSPWRPCVVFVLFSVCVICFFFDSLYFKLHREIGGGGGCPTCGPTAHTSFHIITNLGECFPVM